MRFPHAGQRFLAHRVPPTAILTTTVFTTAYGWVLRQAHLTESTLEADRGWCDRTKRRNTSSFRYRSVLLVWNMKHGNETECVGRSPWVGNSKRLWYTIEHGHWFHSSAGIL
eukprot:3636498-Pyramimonas_sp.AAC.1